MRTTPGSVARQLRKFWSKPDAITIVTAPRQWNRFWRSPAVVSVTAERDRGFGRRPAVITLTPAPGGSRLPLSTWRRSYGDPEQQPAREEISRNARPERIRR